MPQITNVQAIRSREWIFSSLIELMSKKEFEKITISEIAEHSQLDRRTFYRHFKSKEEVLYWGLEQSAHEYETALTKHDQFNSKAVAYSIFLICEKNKDFLLLLYKHNLIHLLLIEMNSLFPHFHAMYSNEEELSRSESEIDYDLSYHIGGFWNIIVKWLSDGARKSPTELALIVEQLTSKSI